MRDYVVRVVENFAVDRFEVWIAERLPDGRVALGRCVDDALEFSVPDEPAREQAPTLQLPRELVEALWVALGRELQLSPHQHDHTREDFEHERARVDRLIEAVIADA